MSYHRISRNARSLATMGACLLVSALLLTGCGLGGGDDNALNTPTPTAEATGSAGESTVDASEANGTGTSTPRTGSMGLADPDASPGATLDSSPGATDGNSTPATTSAVDETPVADAGATDSGTPPDAETNLSSTPGADPRVNPDSATSAAGTPTTDRGTTSSSTDGTSGATPGANDATPGTNDATPAEQSADTVVVDSCEPDDVPEFTGDSADYVVTTDLNFRVGPGSDCDLIDDQVLATGTEITVISDPVERDGEEPLWIQIRVGDQEGWVAADFVDEAP